MGLFGRKKKAADGKIDLSILNDDEARWVYLALAGAENYDGVDQDIVTYLRDLSSAVENRAAVTHGDLKVIVKTCDMAAERGRSTGVVNSDLESALGKLKRLL